ncbi:hypothetical protein B0H16DRAFT_1745566 [Mycena metata]|uniref:Uncharacterized protein n=1 Tax=Mycena metata TaxID=1033252 RepID=A0AAD7H1S8_9AGAR|nr:hypothetical protein B0H16DRAFT_1745566 [Mycena metata]
MLHKDGAGRALPSSKQYISRTLLLTLLPPPVPARTPSSLFRTATAGASVHRANMVPPSATASTSASRGSYSFFGDDTPLPQTHFAPTSSPHALVGGWSSPISRQTRVKPSSNLRTPLVQTPALSTHTTRFSDHLVAARALVGENRISGLRPLRVKRGARRG